MLGLSMKSIVIIEDDADALDLYYELLAQEKYRVFPAHSGRLGLHVVSHELPNLVILDLLIPGDMNGISVLKELKTNEKTASIPILVITNLDSEKDAIMALGASDFLTKANTSLDTILKKVQALVSA